MTKEEIIQGLEFTISMFLFDPSTGETFTEPRNDMDKTTIDACKGAIEMLKREPCEDAISRQAVDELSKELVHTTRDKADFLCNFWEELQKLPPANSSEIPNNSDTISRQAAILIASGYCHPANIAAELAKLPSAQPERKKGYWIESHEHTYIGNGVKEWTNWYCSECDAPNDKPTDFCPNCGAKMVKPHESEE